MKILNYLAKDTRLILNLFKTHSTVLILIICSYFATYGLNVFLARTLDPVGYGEISVVFQLLAFFSPFVLVGTELSILRFFPQYIEEKEYSLMAGFIRWSLKTFLLTSLVILIVGSILVCYSSILTDLKVMKIDKFSIFLYAFWLIPLFAFVVFLTNVLQSLKRYFLSASFGGFGLTLLIILVTTLLIAFFDSTWIGIYQKRFSILLCIGIACIIVALAQIRMLKKHLPPKFFKIIPKYNKKEWLVNSYQMMSSTIVFASLSAIDIMMLQILGKTESQVGHFAAIFVITSSVVVFSTAVDTIINPLIAPSLKEEGSKSHLQAILHILNLFKVVPTIILSIIIIIFGVDLLEHFGKGFSDAYPALLVMLFGFVVGQFLNSSGPLLLYSGHQALSFKISLVQLLSILILDCIFIPLFQLNGAVWVLSISIVLSSIVRTLYCHRNIGIRVFFFY